MCTYRFSFFFLLNETLLTAGGKNFQTYVIENGVLTAVPGYATVQGIFIGVVAAFVILITVVGPEYVYRFLASRLRKLIVCRYTRKHASHFEEHKTAFEEGGGGDDAIIDENEKDDESFKEAVQESSKV